MTEGLHRLAAVLVKFCQAVGKPSRLPMRALWRWSNEAEIKYRGKIKSLSKSAPVTESREREALE